MSALTIILLVILIGLFAFFAWLTIRFAMSKNPDKSFFLPKLKLALVEVEELNRNMIKARITIHIYNPLPFGLTVEKTNYKLLIRKYPVMKIQDNNGMKIKAGTTSKIVVPITILPQNMKSALKDYVPGNPGSEEHEFRIELVLKFGFIRKRWRTVIKRQVPLFQVPRLKYEGIKLEKINVREADLCLNLKLFNRNKFSITAQDITYRFVIDDGNWVTGTIPGHIHIPSRVQTDVSFPVRILFKNIRFLSALRKRGKMTYTLIFTFRLDSTNNIFDNSRVIVESSGTIGSLVQFMRNSS